MNNYLKEVAQKCLSGAEDGTMTFPQIVGTLMQEGFESYAIDFRRASAIYYRPDGGQRRSADASDRNAHSGSLRHRSHPVRYPRSAAARARLHLCGFLRERSWRRAVPATSSHSAAVVPSTSDGPPRPTSSTFLKHHRHSFRLSRTAKTAYSR